LARGHAEADLLQGRIFVAVDRQRLALQGVEDHQRDELLGELVRPVVVRTVGHQHGQPVGVVAGQYEVGLTVYNNEDFFRFRERCVRLGIGVPIVPGMLPVTNLCQLQRIASLCGAKLPEKFVADLRIYEDDPQGQFEVGVEYASLQAQELIAGDAAGLHFYVLNKSAATGRVLERVTMPGR